MTAQRSSWGSNRPAARKGYRVLRYWADAHDGRGYRRHCETVRGTKRDGDRRLAEIRVLHADDRPVPTLGQAYDLWFLPDMRRRLDEYLRDPRPGRRGELMKPSTFDQTESTWRRHVEPAFGSAPVGDIRYSDVQDWLDGKTEQTAQRCRALMRGILRMCVLNGALASNVCDNSFRMPAKAKRFEDGVWTLPELCDALWPAVWGRICEPAFLLCAFDSCRTGESMAPMLCEIERVEVGGVVMASVPILRQVSNGGVASASGDLKNRWSPRPTVVPPPWSLRILQLRDEGMARGETWLSDNGCGDPLGQSRMRSDFERALDAAGIPGKQFRALRRSWRSWIATMGISPEILEKMMGHVGDGTTGRHYLKMTEDAIAGEVARAFSERPVELSWNPLSGPKGSGLGKIG